MQSPMKVLKRVLHPIIFIGAMNCALSASAQNIQNPGFELPILESPGDSSDNSLTNWVGNTNMSRQFGAFYVGPGTYITSVPDGNPILEN